MPCTGCSKCCTSVSITDEEMRLYGAENCRRTRDGWRTRTHVISSVVEDIVFTQEEKDLAIERQKVPVSERDFYAVDGGWKTDKDWGKQTTEISRCVLNDGKGCTVYDIRPEKCRKFTCSVCRSEW